MARRPAKRSSKPPMPSALLAWFQEQGKLGGKRRAESLSPKRRREIGRAAIAARWAKRRKETKG